jgi:hypothetical protein
MARTPFRVSSGHTPDAQGTAYSVTSYGAVGNGVHDDTSAINSAITAAAAAGKNLYFPTGTYLVTDWIIPASNLTLRGAGSGSIIYRAHNAGDVIIWMYNKTGVTFRDLKFASNYANSNGGTYAISSGNCTNPTIEYCYFNDIWCAWKNDVPSTTGANMNNCTFTHCGQPVHPIYVSNSTFTNLVSVNTYYYDLYMEHGCHTVTFNGWNSTRPSGVINNEAWFLCLYTEDADTSDYITFNTMHTEGCLPGVRVNPEFTHILINGFYGRSTHDFNGDAWFNLITGGSLTVENYDVDNNNPLSAGSVVFL